MRLPGSMHNHSAVTHHITVRAEPLKLRDMGSIEDQYVQSTKLLHSSVDTRRHCEEE